MARQLAILFMIICEFEVIPLLETAEHNSPDESKNYGYKGEVTVHSVQFLKTICSNHKFS